MTIRDFLSALNAKDDTTVKIIQEGIVVTKCYTAYWDSLSDELKDSVIESFGINSATSLTITLKVPEV